VKGSACAQVIAESVVDYADVEEFLTLKEILSAIYVDFALVDCEMVNVSYDGMDEVASRICCEIRPAHICLSVQLACGLLQPLFDDMVAVILKNDDGQSRVLHALLCLFPILDRLDPFV